MTDPTNIALLARFADPDWLAAAVGACPGGGPLSLVSDDEGLLAGTRVQRRHLYAEASLGRRQFDAEAVQIALDRLLSDDPAATFLVDMTWGLDTLQAGQTFEGWAALIEGLAAERGRRIISLYNRDLLVEAQMPVVLRAHPSFLAPSGLHANPFWLPAALAGGGTLDEQIAFLLGRAVPDYEGVRFFEQTERSFARGADPNWLKPQAQIHASPRQGTAWHICCLGQLRVYESGHRRVNWKLPGGSPNKTRTLFAFLLHAGDKGAHVDRIGELLWPEGQTEEAKRARLHHTVAMLRNTLGDKGAVIRSGEYYRLNAPEGSFTDISSFEQLCRRGLSLAKQGQEDEALRIYRAAEQIYAGDLFEDLPLEYVDTELEDWCLPRRRWLREMAIKLYRDMSVLFRAKAQTDEALVRCQKALALDAASEDANAEAMRVFHAQGRYDAVTRQYRQYLSALESAGGGQDLSGMERLHQNLVG